MSVEAPLLPTAERFDKPSFISPSVPNETPTFEAATYLDFQPPDEVYTMEQLGLSPTGLSDIAVSKPFPFLTNDAVDIIRSEVLSQEVYENCRWSSSLSACQLRGMAPKYAKFTYDLFHDEVTLHHISSVAGVDLVPVMDLEVAHINLSVKTATDGDSNTPIVGWHQDSFPFVLVLMLSDTTNMTGGETAIRTGNGDIMKVSGPKKGWGVVLQGRHINHIALPTFGGAERVTLVTSFRCKDHNLQDDSGLMTVRPVSHPDVLFPQWCKYRLDILHKRCEDLLLKIYAGSVDWIAIREYLIVQAEFLRLTAEEVVV